MECNISTIYERLEDLKKTKKSYEVQNTEVESLDALFNYGKVTVEGDDISLNLIKGLRQMNIRFMVVSMSEFNKNWYFEMIDKY